MGLYLDQGDVASTVDVLPATDRGWLAGMIDGEGQVTIIRHGTRGYVVLAVANTDREALEYILHLCPGIGGGVYLVDRGLRGRKPSWRWQLLGRAASGVLESLLPHLRIKQKQVAVALEFQRTRNQQGRRRTPEQRADDVLLIGIMRELNHRGSS